MINADLVPSPIVVTDSAGAIVAINLSFLELAGARHADLLGKSMESLFPLASRIFLQTHIWPMLLRDGRVREIRLQLLTHDKKSLAVLGNCQRNTQDGIDQYHWLFFLTYERNRYEAELLEARKRADSVAARFAQGERFLRSVTDAVPSLISYWDRDLRCQFSNQSYLQWFGKSAADMQGIHSHTLLGDTAFAMSELFIQSALAGEPQEFEREITLPNGTPALTLVQYIPDRVPGGNIAGFFAVVTNITRLREADAAIRLSASVFNATTEGILVTDEQGAIVSVNPAFSQITGYTELDVMFQSTRMLGSDRHSPAFYQEILCTLQSASQWKGDVWCRRKNGEIYLNALSLSTIRDAEERVVRYVVVFNDASERHKRDELVQNMALHDGLTGLPNRMLLMERLNQRMAMTAREPQSVAILFLDLDGFKAVNDAHGHEAGDQVLQLVAKRLQELLRTSDTVARLGGDEFVILLHSPDSRQVIAQIAQRIVAVINAPMVFADQTVQVGTSIGIAMHPEDGATAQLLLKRADDAMYRAKSAGKNTFRFHTLAAA